MNVLQKINEIIGEKEVYKVPDVLFEKLMDREKREEMFKRFLNELFIDDPTTDLSYDWFHEYFQIEHAERKTNKQDFTPVSIAKLLAEFTTNDKNHSTTYDVACGTGGLIITKWHAQRSKINPFDYIPSNFLYICEEMSDRTIPFLLFNLSIRGMNAIVIQCDSLSRESKGVFFVQNYQNDHMAFSSINVMPYSEQVEKEFNIKFVEQKYDEHIEDELDMSLFDEKIEQQTLF